MLVVGDALNDYLHDIEICQKYAMRNRELIASMIMEKTSLIDDMMTSQ